MTTKLIFKCKECGKEIKRGEMRQMLITKGFITIDSDNLYIEDYNVICLPCFNKSVNEKSFNRDIPPEFKKTMKDDTKKLGSKGGNFK